MRSYEQAWRGCYPARAALFGGFEVVFSVVGPAEEFEVGEVGGAAVFPVPDVVSFAEAGRDGAAGFGAVAVAGDERPPERAGNVAGGAADVDDEAVAVGDDAVDIAVTRQPFEGRLGEPPVAFAFDAHVGDEVGMVGLVVVEIEDEAEVGLPAPPLRRTHVLVVEQQ